MAHRALNPSSRAWGLMGFISSCMPFAYAAALTSALVSPVIKRHGRPWFICSSMARSTPDVLPGSLMSQAAAKAWPDRPRAALASAAISTGNCKFSKRWRIACDTSTSSFTSNMATPVQMIAACSSGGTLSCGASVSASASSGTDNPPHGSWSGLAGKAAGETFGKYTAIQVPSPSDERSRSWPCINPTNRRAIARPRPTPCERSRSGVWIHKLFKHFRFPVFVDALPRVAHLIGACKVFG